MNLIFFKCGENMADFQETITGIVEDITFQNAQNGFTVLDFSSDEELFTAVGVMP